MSVEVLDVAINEDEFDAAISAVNGATFSFLKGVRANLEIFVATGTGDNHKKFYS
jgi:hypothetical protein